MDKLGEDIATDINQIELTLREHEEKLQELTQNSNTGPLNLTLEDKGPLVNMINQQISEHTSDDKLKAQILKLQADLRTTQRK